MKARSFTVAHSTIGKILILDVAQAKPRDKHQIVGLANTLSDFISRSGCNQVIMDLKGIPFITSEIIGQLIMLHKKCRANDCQLKVCSVGPDNQLALKLVRFDSLVDIYELKAQAIAAFKVGAQKPPVFDEGELSATEYLEKAETGDLDAMFDYGRCLEAGREVTQDFIGALKWYERAAKRDHPESQHALGAAYAYGMGVTQDFGKAFRWYKRAADLGHPEAQYWIGVSMQYGLIDEVDTQRAIKWYNEAAEQGYEPARTAMDELKRAKAAE